MLSYVKLMDEIVESDTEAAKWFTKIEALFSTPSVRSRSHAQSVNRNLVFSMCWYDAGYDAGYDAEQPRKIECYDASERPAFVDFCQSPASDAKGV